MKVFEISYRLRDEIKFIACRALGNIAAINRLLETLPRRDRDLVDVVSVKIARNGTPWDITQMLERNAK